MDRTAVRQELAKAAKARAGKPADAVCGVRAAHVVAPASTDEVAEVLRVAGHHDLAVLPRGSGSKLDWGGSPDRADVLLDTAGITGVVEHAAGDLVVVVRAGTPVRELQDVVGRAGQQLALDVPFGSATVGGTLAAATSGPRRLLYGTARDLLIGITFVRGDGVVAKAGGRVVKNVAGYDFGKLLTGSWGTLGVITEAVFRLHPVPAARRVVTATFPDADSAGRAALAVAGSQVVPTAVELDQHGGGHDATVTVAALVEGVAASVDARAAALIPVLGGDAIIGDPVPSWFGALPFSPGDTGLKVTSALTGVGPLLTAARRLAGDAGLPLTMRGSAAGVLYAGLPPDADPGAVHTVVDGLRATAARYDGSLTVLTAPPDVRHAVDMWGPVPGLDLMRRLKHEMDPDRRLSPGRFVGGI
jgi:glycolate oxidase FAD binding subunit